MNRGMTPDGAPAEGSGAVVDPADIDLPATQPIDVSSLIGE